MKKIIVVMGMTLAILLIITFTCYAHDQTYYGCYDKTSGQLKILTHYKSDHKDYHKDGDKDDYANKCKPSEVFISWNEMGPQGPAGPAGAKGDTGAQGPQGIQGPMGLTGVGIAKVVDNPDGTFTIVLTDLNQTTYTIQNPTTNAVGTRTCTASISAYCNGTDIPCVANPPLISSCVSKVSRTQSGYYDITFSKEFQSPICVIYVYPFNANPTLIIWANYWEIASSTGISGIKVNTYTVGSEGGSDDRDVDFNFICTEP
jgi:hypothetical protein